MKTPVIAERPVPTGPPDPAARASMYGLLSAVFLRPAEPELLQSLSETDLFEELSLLYGRGGEARAEAGPLEAFRCNNPAELKQEYMDLFAVPTGRYVFPFEDVYRGTVRDGSAERKGPLLGPCAVAVKSLFRQAGVQMSPSCRELPTHIGVELAFMNLLCRKDAGANDERHVDAPRCMPADEREEILNGNRRVQLAFLTEHLNEWFPQLSLSIQAKASSRFYRSLALLTEQFLFWDTSSLLESTHVDVE